MDDSTHIDEHFAARWIDLSEVPSPWLRLAHFQDYTDPDADRAHRRPIFDHEFVLRASEDSCIVFPSPGGSIARPSGSVTLIPRGLVQGQSFTRGSHSAIPFDLRPNFVLGSDQMVRSHCVTDRRVPRTAPPLVISGGDHLQQCPLVQRPDHAEWWLERARSLVGVWTSCRHRLSGQRLRCAAILCDLVYAFCFGRPARPDSNSLEARVEGILRQVGVCDRTLHEPDLIAQAQLGETAIRDAVKRSTAITRRAWLEQRRSNLPVVLLQNSVMTFRSLAMACGYDDPYHFSSVMHRQLGRWSSQI